MKVPAKGDSGTDKSLESSSKGNRRGSSSLKHTFTSILRSGSSGASSQPSSREHNVPVSASTPGISNAQDVFYPHDAYNSSPSKRISRDNNERVINEDDFDDADVESDGFLSESEDLQSYYGSLPPKASPQTSSGQRYLINYLSERGFLQPKLLSSKNGVSLFTATSSEIIFLPTISSQDDEYLSHLAMSGEADIALEPSNSQTQFSDSVGDGSSIGREANSSHGGSDGTSLGSNHSQGLDADGKNAVFNIALIVSLKRPIRLSTIKAQLYSRARVYWQNGVPPQKNSTEEYYNVGELNWDLSIDNFNLYVPQHITSSNSIVEKREQVISSHLFKNKENLETQSYLEKKKSKQNLIQLLDENPDQHTFQAGDYVFLLPIFFSNNIPETIYLPSGRVNYSFRCATKIGTMDLNDDSQSEMSVSSGSTSTIGSEDHQNDSSSHLKFPGNKLLRKVRDHLHSHPDNDLVATKNLIHGNYSIPVVRIPPVMSVSTADKPVYINRVWNESLSYEVSLSKKYIPIGSDLPIKIKLVPLVKKISIKRLRVSVLEKITFVSKNLEYEFDQTEAISKDPYSPYYSEFACRRKQERILPLLEVRTKERGSRAIREEVVDNSRSDNLLSYTTCPSTSPDKTPVEIVDPLTIETTIRFPKYSVLDKRTSRNVPPYGVDEFTTVHQQLPTSSSSRRGSTASGMIGLLSGRRPSTSFRSRNNSVSNAEAIGPSTRFKSSSNMNVEWHTRLNDPKRGLYLDSVNFKNIHVKHKLEVMLRISTPDTESGGVEKHYEVLIDTPIFLVSELCTSDNIELPTYDMALRNPSSFDNLPPTFEQAISVPASPVGSPLASPIASPNLVASYDDELSIQQLSLSRVSTQNGTDHGPPEIPPPTGRRYSNLDYLMNQPAGGSGDRFIFGDGYQINEQGRNREENAVLSDDEPPKYVE